MTTDADMVGLRDEMAEVRQAVTVLAEAIHTNTELLRRVYEAATAEPEPSELGQTLKDILKALNDQGAAMADQMETLEDLPRDIERAVARGLRRAVGAPESGSDG